MLGPSESGLASNLGQTILNQADGVDRADTLYSATAFNLDFFFFFFFPDNLLRKTNGQTKIAA